MSGKKKTNISPFATRKKAVWGSCDKLPAKAREAVPAYKNALGNGPFVVIDVRNANPTTEALWGNPHELRIGGSYFPAAMFQPA